MHVHHKAKTFRAPLVPFAPCLGLLANFFLMAQYDVLTHLYLVSLVAAALAADAWNRFG